MENGLSYTEKRRLEHAKGKQAEPSGYPFNKQKSKIQNSKLFVD
jgi:hypothetical protein